MTNTNRLTASYLDKSRFGHASGGSRLRTDLRLFMLHAAGGHDRQSHSGDNNERLHAFPRWENLSGHFLRLSESHSFCGGEKKKPRSGRDQERGFHRVS